MSPDRLARIKDLYRAALEHRPDERPHFLSVACGSDHELRRDIELCLISADSGNSEFEKTPRGPMKDLLTTQLILAVGAQLGPYRLEGVIGKGGMGTVYRAVDTRLGRQVALKFVSDPGSEHAELMERFRREARAASALNHPNICTIYDVGEIQGQPFLVMEVVEGESLKQRISRGPLGIQAVVDIGVHVLAGLDAAHSRRIIHRDIKPANIFVTDRGQVKILDFGLAKAVVEAAVSTPPTPADADTDTLTRPGTTVGTVAYMSPQQVRSEELDA
jgi:eukaryotic-like serine/threonine-protein kinase